MDRKKENILEIHNNTIRVWSSHDDEPDATLFGDEKLASGATKKKLMPAILLALLFLVVINSNSLWQDYDPREISLKQAVSLCFPEAIRWSNNARLAYAISTEAGEDSEAGSQGKNGLWFNWNVIFVEEDTGRNLLVAVRQGRTAYTRELLLAFKNPINPTELKYDSPSAVKILSSIQNHTQPIRVHFELLNQHTPVLRVYLDYSHTDSLITSLDERTGQVISQWDRTVDENPMLPLPVVNK